jgi:hypothetical protein
MARRMNRKDKLARACLLVGQFMYHFGLVEQKIDQAVIKLLRLDKKCAPIVGLLDFAKKANDLVRANAVMQATNRKDKDFVNDVCNRANAVNGRRRIVAHASFKPARDGGVLFSRAVTAKGSVHPLSQPWSDEAFATFYADMTALEADLEKLIARIKPMPVKGVITWLSALSEPVPLRRPESSGMRKTAYEALFSPIPGSKKSDR